MLRKPPDRSGIGKITKPAATPPAFLLCMSCALAVMIPRRNCVWPPDAIDSTVNRGDSQQDFSGV